MKKEILLESNNKVLWALTQEAKNMLSHMVNQGWDRDLALSVLEELFEESEIYELAVNELDF